MTGKSEDSDGEKKGQQFTPTDWDWVMFLSGEINAVKTSSDTVWTAVIAISCAFMGFLIMFMGFLIACSNPNSIVTIMIRITGAIIGVVFVCIFLYYIKYRREDEDRAELLEKCREGIFNRLDDPNKILECYSNAVEKKR